MFRYIFNGITQTNTTLEFMQGIGMDSDQIESVLRQKTYEEGQYIAKREAAYTAESDPLYMEAQFDDTEESLKKWHDKVAEIKLRYPAPTI